MALKIRLRKQGRKNRPFFRVVVTDTRSPRDGKYIESLGWYNPIGETEEQNLFLDTEKLQKWIADGVQLTDCVQVLLARGAPELFKSLREKEQAARVKIAAKRRELRKKKAAAKA